MKIPGYTHHQTDLANPNAVKTLEETIGNVDVIIHLAAQACVLRSFEFPNEYVRDNSFAQKRALVADSRFKIIQKRQTKKRFDKPIVYLLIGATLFFLFIQMGIITPMTLHS